MTTTPDLPAVIAAVTWASGCLRAMTTTPSGSPERRAALEELRRATVRARQVVDQHEGRIPDLVRALLRMAELGLTRAVRSESTSGRSP